MKKYILLLLLGLFMVDCKEIEKDGVYAVFKTNKGSFTCELYYDKTPVTVASFAGLASGTIDFTDPKSGSMVKRKFYDGLTFHRIIKGFVIQGGDPNGNGTGGPGYKFFDEIDESLKHDGAGYLSMANSGPDTNGSQFFITLAATPHLDGKHAIFGKVVDGMDIINKIAEVKVNSSDMPYDPVVINSIKIIKNGAAAQAYDEAKVFAEMDTYKQKSMEKFLSKIGITDMNALQKTETGLRYIVTKKGTGVTPNKGNTIVAHYTGYFENGRVFDSSYERNEPFSTPIGVGRVIKGWDEAFLTMKEGEKRVLIIPYYLAYGEMGYPGAIPPKATLIFEVELLEVK